MPETTVPSIVARLENPDLPIRINAVRQSEGAMTIELAGEIRIDTSELLPRWILDHYAESKPSQIVLDFTQVRFLDSQGLALLFSIYKSLNERGCALAIRHASPHIGSLIEMTRLHDFIDLG